MTYEEWLEIINYLKNGSHDQDKLKKLQQEPINNNINNLLIPKLKELIKSRFDYSIQKIINELDFIFSDVNYLDLSLLTFKKDLRYIKELTELKQLPKEEQDVLKDYINNQTESAYNILKKEADRHDYTGVLSITIDNNRFKWSE